MDDIDRTLLSLLEEDCTTPEHDLAIMLECTEKISKIANMPLKRRGTSAGTQQ